MPSPEEVMGSVVAGTLGFAEATLFFIVPDVWLTYSALHDLKQALRQCGAALAGAMLGGALMYGWGVHAPETALRMLDWVPAISPDMLDEVASDLREWGVLAVLTGPGSGIPYKIFAVQSPHSGIGFAAFLAITVPARLGRFMLLTLLAGGIARISPGNSAGAAKKGALLGIWFAFYAFYFAIMPN